MIPTIGIIIGFYVITKMVDIISNKNSSLIAKAFTAPTIVVSVIGILDLFMADTP